MGGNGIFVSVAETGGDVEEHIFRHQVENNLIYDDARVELRENTTYTSKALEPFNYNSRLVRETELGRARIWMTQFNVSEHTAREELSERVKLKSGEDLDKKRGQLPLATKLDLLIAIDGVHQRLMLMYKPAMCDEDVILMHQQIEEVSALRE